jgi:hypothetical protein
VAGGHITKIGHAIHGTGESRASGVLNQHPEVVTHVTGGGVCCSLCARRPVHTALCVRLWKEEHSVQHALQQREHRVVMPVRRFGVHTQLLIADAEQHRTDTGVAFHNHFGGDG